MNQIKYLESIKTIDKWLQVRSLLINYGVVIYELILQLRNCYEEKLEDRVAFEYLFHSDLILCLLHMGHDPLYQYDKEEIMPLKYAIYKTRYSGKLEFSDYFVKFDAEIKEFINDVYDSSYVYLLDGQDRLNFIECLEDIPHSEESIGLMTDYCKFIKEYSNAIAHINEPISSNESSWLNAVEMINEKARQEESDFWQYEYEEDWNDEDSAD